jgi:hypothetical protein
MHSVAYQPPAVVLKTVYPSFYRQLKAALPFYIFGVRFCQSQDSFPAHRDNHKPSWQLRCMMQGSSDQWYYERLNKTDRKPLVLSPETNWWSYLDGECLHGTEFKPDDKKTLVQVYSLPLTFKRLSEDGIRKFPGYQIEFN